MDAKLKKKYSQKRINALLNQIKVDYKQNDIDLINATVMHEEYANCLKVLTVFLNKNADDKPIVEFSFEEAWWDSDDKKWNVKLTESFPLTYLQELQKINIAPILALYGTSSEKDKN